MSGELGIDRARLCDDYTSFVDYPCQELLRKVREDLSLSQAQIAQEIGVSQNSYSGWERGARTPRRNNSTYKDPKPNGQSFIPLGFLLLDSFFIIAPLPPLSSPYIMKADKDEEYHEKDETLFYRNRMAIHRT
ncbi:MAG: helix-turn-helix domain-containing protein [Clostridiales bacterium]|nr:helix-turn-helix domain-containing protein [Clostridiales bacterium]